MLLLHAHLPLVRILRLRLWFGLRHSLELHCSFQLHGSLRFHSSFWLRSWLGLCRWLGLHSGFSFWRSSFCLSRSLLFLFRFYSLRLCSSLRLCFPLVAPQVPLELHDSFIAAIDKGSIRTMPNRSMPAAPYPTPGALLIGDAFNMRHPLTGGGMTGALYKVFCASPDQARKEMHEACFDYLSLGGVCSTGPVALLSGLNPSPLSLILHFFAIAIYGVGRLLLPFPSPKRLWIAARLFLGASAIIFPLFLSHGLVPSLSSV
ncbi:hypothetical protein CsSME_00033606 [Camellia sinensis var. sinensis]